ncbi:MAG: ABC transporter substrate-binding protein [Rhodobacteraceae bacterium]|nr:ABC transporter substrate-binding protein [Paracoccaceae bacterium]
MKRLLFGVAAAALLAGAAQAAKTDLTLGVGLEPPNLDPTAGAAAAIDEVVYANVFEGLTRIDETGAAQPALARSWEISEDGLTYVFHLVEGATFHDGAAFDASDVKFSFDRAMAEDSQNAQKVLFEPIETIEVVDPATVKITLKRPTGAFLFNMGWGDAVIVDPESAATNATHPVGTGPFVFGDWAKGASITLEKNPDYWGEPAQLDRATFKFISDPTAALAALMAGDVDGFPIWPSPETVPQIEADPRFDVVMGSTEGETILGTNNAKAPFDQLKVRQAIAHALDRQAIVDGAMFGVGTPIYTHYPPHGPAFEDLSGLYPHDLDKARALLAEAGFPDGFDATLKLPPPAYARRGGEVVAAQLREIGIRLEIIPVEWAQWLEQVFKGKDFDLTIVSHTEPRDINIYARPDYYFGYGKPEFQALMEELNAATDAEAQNANLRKAGTMIAEDAVNGYLFQLGKIGVWRAKLKGMWANQPTQAIDLTAVRWVD